MTVWWGLAGLLGLLGCCGLLRSHRAADDDPLARYPAAREPAVPNADTAHTPLMTPAITPEMLARPAPPVAPGRVSAVPETGTIAGEIPPPRPGTAEPGIPAPAPAVRRVSPQGSAPARAPVARRVSAPASRRAGAAQVQSQPEHRPAEPETPSQQEEIPAQQPPRAAEEQPEPGLRHEKPTEPQARPGPVSMFRGLVGKAKRLVHRDRE
ncbi:hypothetical protein [Amycolatopsis sp. NPDC021455]|uniref:hypothetical protein n=1 Tax=Amycolatopsis sp. NPDC021455 TaxID=3154901 RepID=UPI00340C036A